jgi:hypothetical protein
MQFHKRAVSRKLCIQRNKAPQKRRETRTEAAHVIDLLLERESTVEDQAACASKPEHLMRLFFIDAQLKLVRLEASSSRKIFVYSSPELV